MPDNIGPHLLGRIPSPPDERDWKLENFVGEGDETSTPLDDALAALTSNKSVAAATKTWATFITNYLKSQQPAPNPQPTPTPTPTPSPTTDVVWADTQQLDQGDTGHCVGFGCAQWGNSLPIEDHFTNDDGHAIYYECKVIDGEPNNEDGTYVRSGAKAMKNRGRLSAYAFSTDIETIKTFVLTQGPVIIGSDWYNNMFDPDSNGFVKPTGGIAGGHCFLLVGYHSATDSYEFQNSWGSSWGVNGRFFLHSADFVKLLNAQGEACAAVELAL